MEDKRDLGIYSDVPWLYRIMKAIAFTMNVLFLKPISFFLSDFIILILAVLIITGKLRFYVDSALLDTGIVIIIVIIALILGYLLSKALPWLSRILFGKPVFGKIGGLDRKTFFTSLKCIDNIKFEFIEEDVERVKNFNKLDAEITEEILKQNYLKDVYNPAAAQAGTFSALDFRSEWEKVWNEEILTVGTDGITFKDAMSEDNAALRVIPLKLVGSALLISPLIKVFQIIMIFFISRFLNGESQLLLVIQLGVFFSFILSVLWYIFNSHQMVEMPMSFVNIPENIKSKFSDRIDQFTGKTFRPKKITVKKRYFSLVRSYELRQILVTFQNSILLLVLVGIVLLIGLLGSPGNRDAIASWYKNFSIGLIILPFAFYIGFYIVSVITQHIKRVLAPIVAALVAALAPLFVNYLYTGSFQLGEAKIAIMGVITGAGVLVGTAISELIKKVMEED